MYNDLNILNSSFFELEFYVDFEQSKVMRVNIKAMWTAANSKLNFMNPRIFSKSIHLKNSQFRIEGKKCIVILRRTARSCGFFY